MTLHQAQQQLQLDLSRLYPSGEAEAITDMVIEALTGLSKMERVVQRDSLLASEKRQQLERWRKELLEYRPVQYVIGSCWFYKQSFKVNEAVLIPRSETEELVHWIITSSKPTQDPITITDIGTGSGCIAVSLKVELPLATIFAIDKSKEALEMAAVNAREIGVTVGFVEMDFLDPVCLALVPNSDIIVSNPPYIPAEQEKEMDAHVVKHEPFMALFVSDEDPLVFYHRIAAVGKARLQNNGWVYVEIHESYGNEVTDLFRKYGYSNVELKQDMQGKDRMIRAQYLSSNEIS